MATAAQVMRRQTFWSLPTSGGLLAGAGLVSVASCHGSFCNGGTLLTGILLIARVLSDFPEGGEFAKFAYIGTCATGWSDIWARDDGSRSFMMPPSGTSRRSGGTRRWRRDW